MATIIPTTVLDNESLRIIMREREQLSTQQPSVSPVIISGLMKSNFHQAPTELDKLLTQARQAPEQAFRTQLQLPGILRQLHLELCSSTHLRPLAKIMGTKAIIPDPFITQGGLWQSQNPITDIKMKHIKTNLYTSLRLDILLHSENPIHLDNEPGNNIRSGDALLVYAKNKLSYASDFPFYIWTAFYYLPQYDFENIAD